jgi:hypothetical protein
MSGSWTSQQIATLAVDALTPIAVAGVGYFIVRVGRRMEQARWVNQSVVNRRLEIFTQSAPGLNRLLCFATFAGGWTEIQPLQALAIKRELDETMYSNRTLFSDQLFTAYYQFMATMFSAYATRDADARLRVPIASQWGDRRNMPWWEEHTAHLFSPDNLVGIDDIQDAYDQLAQRFRADLYVKG